MSFAFSFLSKFDFLNANGLASMSFGGVTVSLPSLYATFNNIEDPAGLGGIIASPGSIVQTLTKGARGVFCIGALLTDPAMMLNMLKMCGQYLAALGLKFVNDIYKSCISRINRILSTVYGIVLGYFNTIKNIITAIKNLGDLWEKITNFKMGESLLDKLFKKENCDYFIANIMRCMMNKLLEPYISKYKRKINQKITDFADGIESNIVSSTAPLTSMSNFLDMQATSVNKFTAQVGELL